MGENRETLPHILVTCGPSSNGVVRLMATDISTSGLICKWTSVLPKDDWVGRVQQVFKEWVDPATLETLKNQHESILAALKEGKGSVWVFKDAVRIVTL